MIAEWFYPKELKEIIADLRAKDDLNEQALKVLEHSPIVSLLLFGFVFVVIFFNVLPNWTVIIITGAVCIVLGFVLMILTILASWSRMRAYLRGKRNEGEVISVLPYVGINPQVRIKVKNLSSQQNIVFIGDYIEWHLDKKICPQKGERIYYFSDGDNMRSNMPDRLEIKIKYCLSKSMALEKPEVL